MPLYEYQCDQCGATVERIQKFSDPPLEVCGKCGGKLERLLSSPAIQFKGSGWYITDYARKASPSDTAKASADKSPTSTESKKAADPAPAKPSADSK